MLSATDVTNAIRVECPVKSQEDARVLGYVLDAGAALIGGWEELLPSHLTGAGNTALSLSSVTCLLSALCLLCSPHSQRSQSPVMSLSALSVSIVYFGVLTRAVADPEPSIRQWTSMLRAQAISLAVSLSLSLALSPAHWLTGSLAGSLADWLTR